MTKNEFLQVLECLTLWLEDRNDHPETHADDHPNAELFDIDGDLPF